MLRINEEKKSPTHRICVGLFLLKRQPYKIHKMKTFKPSNELVDILTNNRIIETTKSDYPIHYARIKKRGYDPGSCKRNFRVGKSNLIFDYVNINFFYGSVMRFSRLELNVDKVKRIITFFSMPSFVKRKIIKENKKEQVFQYIDKCLYIPDNYQNKVEKLIHDKYVSIKI